MRCASFVVVAFAFNLLVTACGSPASQAHVYVCEPACPPGTSCGESGCTSTTPFDLGVSIADLAGDGCQPPCSGANGHCAPGNVCVPCLEDAHCPAGSVCRPAGAGALCVPGCADDARCGGEPKRCCDGACVDTSTDTANCGECGALCSPAHAASACTAGACSAGTCETGWADCNRDLLDGCETNLRVDARNCSACGTTCAFTHATSGCSSGCYLQSCNFGFDDCNGNDKDGCETSVLSDIKNCGACGRTCPPAAHARNACINATCQLTSCDPGFADCDGDPRNGCEVNTNIEVQNCGRCGAACGNEQVCVNGGCTCKQCNIPNAKTRCVNLVCTFDGCGPGFADCDNNVNNGCEVDLNSDKANCGACSHACAMGESCANGMCTVLAYTNGLGGFYDASGMNKMENAKLACESNMGVGNCCNDGCGSCNNKGYHKCLAPNCNGSIYWNYDNLNQAMNCGWVDPNEILISQDGKNWTQ